MKILRRADIICLQEIGVHTLEAFKEEGWTVIETKESKKIATLVKPELKPRLMQGGLHIHRENNTSHTLWVSIDKETALLNIYIPPETKADQLGLLIENLTIEIQTTLLNHKAIIIGGDLNARIRNMIEWTQATYHTMTNTFNNQIHRMNQDITSNTHGRYIIDLARRNNLICGTGRLSLIHI